MGRKVLIITALLRPEAWEKPDEELEADIKKRLSLEDIPWVERLEKIRVLSEEGWNRFYRSKKVVWQALGPMVEGQ